MFLYSSKIDSLDFSSSTNSQFKTQIQGIDKREFILTWIVQNELLYNLYCIKLNLDQLYNLLSAGVHLEINENTLTPILLKTFEINNQGYVAEASNNTP